MRFLRAAASVLLASIVLLTIVVAVVLPYAILIRVMERNAMYPTMRTPRVKISEAYPHLKTGDILLFVTAAQQPLNCGLSQTFFTHAAMLLREGPLIYTTEAQKGTELMPASSAEYCMKSGAATAPLLTRIKYYTGSAYVMRLSRPLDFAREKLLKTVAKRLHAEEHPYPTVWQGIVAAITGRKMAARHCFQHVAYLLSAVGLKFANSGTLQVCRDVCGLAGRALSNGFVYGPPIQLLYDLDSVRFTPEGGYL